MTRGRFRTGVGPFQQSIIGPPPAVISNAVFQINLSKNEASKLLTIHRHSVLVKMHPSRSTPSSAPHNANPAESESIFDVLFQTLYCILHFSMTQYI